MINTKLLKKSVVGKDFLSLGYIPVDIDLWLDYRTTLMTMREEKKHPSVWIENEINAIDHIINIING
ncbi:hypothetical protein [Maribacter dokdonensis]|nr:hypothetical protein [Maribacter dokdonensis]